MPSELASIVYISEQRTEIRMWGLEHMISLPCGLAKTNPCFLFVAKTVLPRSDKRPGQGGIDLCQVHLSGLGSALERNGPKWFSFVFVKKPTTPNVTQRALNAFAGK